jgi:hypothetical protein
MENYRYLEHNEIDDLYEDLRNWIADYAYNNSKHANMSLAAFQKCSQDQVTLGCPLENTVGLNITEFSDLLKSDFPGASVYNEELPNGTQRIILDIPTRVLCTQKTTTTRPNYGSSSAPSTKWLVILITVELCLGAAIRFRMG